MDEEQVMSFLALWEAGKKRTWSENKQLKAARKKDRRHFDDKDSRPDRPTPRRRLPVAELKKITRCSNCDWREGCTRPYRSKSEREKSEHSSTPGQASKAPLSAFAYLGSGNTSAFSSFFETQLNMFTIPAGNAIIDPGAAQDLIGVRHYEQLKERLKEVGLQTVELKEDLPAASGVGGSAKAVKTALSPCILGGQPGIVKLVVIEGEVPHLLSIGLLEHAGSVIDTATGKITFKNFGTEAHMGRLSSGHRTLNIADWGGGIFPAPKEVQEAFELPTPKRGVHTWRPFFRLVENSRH